MTRWDAWHAKRMLQEWVQARGLAAGVRERRVSARRTAPKFVVTVAVDGFSGSGTAGSKRAAEQLAAKELLRLAH